MSVKSIQRSTQFTEISGIIQAGKVKAFEAVNFALIETYWSVGEQLSRKVSEADWGKGIVKELADWLRKQAPDLKGFSSSNLWTMKQFYDTHLELPKRATLLRELSWSKHLLVLSQFKSTEVGRKVCATAIVSFRGFSRAARLSLGGLLAEPFLAVVGWRCERDRLP